MRLPLQLLEELYVDFLEILPSILMGLAFIIVAIILYKSIIWIVKRLLKASKIEKLNSIINNNELLQNSNVKIDISNIIIGILKFIVVLIILIIGAEFLELKIVSEQIGKLLEYLPKLLIGLIIFVFGTYLASQAKKLIHSLMKSLDAGGAKAISSIVFYLLFIFVSITALNQIGVDTEIISNNLSYFIGAALVAVTIAIGLGSRDIVYRLILGFYTKKNLEIGMKIEIDQYIGIIESIDNICLVLKTETERVMIPIKKVNNSDVRILS
jgi:hypothetical protein